MSGHVKVYLIWYGDWAKRTKALDIIEDLIRSVSTSKVYQTLRDYCSLDGKTTANARVSLGGSHMYTTGYKKGGRLTDAQLYSVVDKVLLSGVFGPGDPTAVYFVLTSPDVYQGLDANGFCSSYCGWHDSKVRLGKSIKFAFVGDATTQCPSTCGNLITPTGKDLSPNGDFGADAAASILVHELIEAISDPEPSFALAWLDTGGLENADKCSWVFGLDPMRPSNWINGTVSNSQIGNRRFLIQQNWVNKFSKTLGDGYCGGTENFAARVSAPPPPKRKAPPPAKHKFPPAPPMRKSSPPPPKRKSSPPPPPKKRAPPPPPMRKCLAKYAACGGRSTCGGEDKACRCCVAGLKCVRKDQWFFQCL